MKPESTREAVNHLSDEALNDVLIGRGTEASQLHLEKCAFCREKVERFQSGLAAWKTAALHWSEARTERARQIRVRPAWPRPLLIALGWSLGAVALLAIVVPVGRERGLFGTHRDNAAFSRVEDSEAQIAQDNELLKAVNAAINPDEISPLMEYDLSERPHPRHRHRPH